MAIKASELRIGNILEFSNNITPAEIITVGRRFFSSAAIEKEDGDFELTPYYKPISLTEEWLLKFGFRKGIPTYRYHFGEDFLTFDLDDFSVQIGDSWAFPSKQYVHELQNLIFALTNEELQWQK